MILVLVARFFCFGTYCSKDLGSVKYNRELLKLYVAKQFAFCNLPNNTLDILEPIILTCFSMLNVYQ